MSTPKKKKSKLRWLLVVLAIPLVLAAGVAAVGSLLPKEFAGQAERVFPHPPEAVFAAMANAEKHPLAASMARKVERLADENGLPVWREDLGSSTVTVRTTEIAPPRRLVRELKDSIVPMQSRWEIDLRPEGQGTRVVIAQTGTLERGTWHVPFFRVVMRLLGGARKGPEAYLDALGEGLGGSTGG